MYASGLTIDSWMNAVRFMFPSAFASEAGALSRSGPIVPVEFAGLNVWHEAHPFAAKTAFPAAALPLPPPPPPPEVVVAEEVVVAALVVCPGAVTVCTTVADGLLPSVV